MFQPIISIKKHKTVPDTSYLTLLWCHFTQMCIRLKECSAEWSSRPNVLVCYVRLVFLWPVSQTCLSFGILNRLWCRDYLWSTEVHQKKTRFASKCRLVSWPYKQTAGLDQHPHQSQLGIQSLQDYTVLSSVFLNNQANPGNQKYVTSKAILCLVEYFLSVIF